jgi:hypothetical protein
MANNRTRTAQRRQAETRRKMATSPKGLSREERQGLERSNAASQGVGKFPGTATSRKAGGKMESEKMATRPTPRPTRAPAASKKPTPRPSTAEERAAGARGDAAAKREAGMKAGGKVKKMQAGGEPQSRAAARADRLRRELEAREGRSARQEAEYQAAQQARREKGGLSRLAMIPEAIRRAQVRAGDRMLASSQARENAPKRREVEAADREVTDTLGRKAGGKVKKMVMGGKCRGMGKATRGGNFSRG